jgi:hypothetical protein
MLKAIATACFCGLPASISIRILSLIVSFDDPFFSGIRLLLIPLPEYGGIYVSIHVLQYLIPMIIPKGVILLVMISENSWPVIPELHGRSFTTRRDILYRSLPGYGAGP